MPEPCCDILALANQKGGVGKTTTAINLAAGFAASGEPTLLLDLDPQGNASTGLGIDRRARRAGTYSLLLEDEPAEDAVQPTAIANLHIVAADPDLVGAEIELVGRDRREFRLKERLLPLRAAYRTIVIDCPPSLGLLTLNGLVAATGVVVPLQCEFFALEGIAQLARTVDRIRQTFNPGLHMRGIVLTMFDRRNNLSELVAADARSFFGGRVCDTVIPRNIRISEAPSHGKPVLTYDRASAGALAYARLTEELVARRGASG